MMTSDATTANQGMIVGRTIGHQVSEIMTPWPILLTLDQANVCDPTILQKAKEQSITFLPVMSDERVVGMAQCDQAGTPVATPLSSDWFIASDTWILELLDLFAAKPDRVFLVMGSRHVIGLVAPADLNKIPARASVYLLSATVERALAGLIGDVIGNDEASLEEYLPQGRFKKLVEEKAKARVDNLDLPLLHYTYVTDLVEIVAGHEVLRSTLGYKSKGQAKKALNFGDLRNGVSHLTRNLVTRRDDIQHINEACNTLIALSRKINQHRGSTEEASL